MENGPWWQEGTLYQIYPRSFQDGDGDGTGDIAGLIERLDHLSWLGVSGIWLNPIHPSPNRDWGYDVSDYTDVASDLGTLEDLDRLVMEAGALGIRVLLDLVPNHTSDQHPWFRDASSSRNSDERDRYVWASAAKGGGPPNNWQSVFGGSAWELDADTDQYFLHLFLKEQPDLNWWNEDVRSAFDDILRFWFERGIAGFRVDVAHGIVKDRELRDDPPARELDPLAIDTGAEIFSLHRPEVHDIFRRWRAIADGREPPGVFLGEAWARSLADLSTYYGDGDELNMAFNFAFSMGSLGAERMRTVVEATEKVMPAHAWPVWTGSNHDVGRLATRWCAGDDRAVRCALLILLTLRGTPVLYAGDEIGLPDVPVPRSLQRDPVGSGDPALNRDRCRTPMPWTPGPNGGFTDPGSTPWLPIGDPSARNVADQRADESSILWWCRTLIGLRRRVADLRAGPYRTLPTPPDAWAWRRGDRTVVAVNLADVPTRLELPAGTVIAGTHPDRMDEALAGSIELRPWEGVIAQT
jgi:alpha-glucosidase